MADFARREDPQPRRHGSVEQEQPLPEEQLERAPGEESEAESFDGAVGERAESGSPPVGPSEEDGEDAPL